MNTFAIKIARQAEKVEFTNLSPEEKKNLFDNRKFVTGKDEIYSFKIAMVMTPGRTKKRNALKRDYNQADTLLVEIRSFTGFTLHGIHPVSAEYSVTATKESGAEGEAQAGIKPLFVSFKPVGRAKEEIKFTRTSILRSFDETYGQWVFLKPYLQNHFEYNFLITNRRIAGDAPLSFICEVDVQQRGRSLLACNAKRRIACVDKL